MKNALFARRLSTVQSGSWYEDHVHAILTRYPFFTFKKCGKSADEGIDLIGHYQNTIPIIVQCKNHQLANTPSIIRELQGVLSYQEQKQQKKFVGILVCSGGVKEGSLSFLLSSLKPLGIMKLSLHAPYPTSLLLNSAACQLLPKLKQRSVYYYDESGSLVKGVDLN